MLWVNIMYFHGQHEIANKQCLLISTFPISTPTPPPTHTQLLQGPKCNRWTYNQNVTDGHTDGQPEHSIQHSMLGI